ncbi:MAG: hypothetical protein NDI93_08970 [Pseudomonas sp.]|nr:hypothetical protein [Pseudomonas sp.]
MARAGRYSILPVLLGWMVFAAAGAWHSQHPEQPRVESLRDRVVVSAPVLAALYAGDRFLAANLETIRLAATSMEQGEVDVAYLIRAQRVVAELNPCHEDNYYLANGLLTWGGAVREGNDILRKAMDCRFWDGVPGFFYGANSYFFDRDVDEAVRAFGVSAERWPENASALRKLAIMLRVETFADEKLALNYLQQQRDSSRDPQLRAMLDKRVVRLQGLADLRAAQKSYEQTHGTLTDLSQLVGAGMLQAIPKDPLGIGYELRGKRVELKKLKIEGLEEQP